MAYEVTVLELPAKHLVGLCTRMNIADSAQQCPALWEKFASRWHELTGVVEDFSYGVSVNMTQNGDLDYWAALATAPGIQPPSGMSSLDLRAGKYARCVVADLDAIADAYGFLYGEWGKTQGVDFTSACFEQYRKDWQETDSVDLYVPLV